MISASNNPSREIAKNTQMVGYALESEAAGGKPRWLEALLSEKFFGVCARHAASKKSERNIFCVDCSGSICHHCLCGHSGHRLVQVRRYVYHDVIRLHDVQKLLDCSHVQTYIINSARVVFLNQRPQPRPTKGLANCCHTCDRSLQESYRFCSIACKVDAAFSEEADGSISLAPSNQQQQQQQQQNNLQLEEELDEEMSPVSSSDEVQSQSSSGYSDNEVGCFDHTVPCVLLIPPPKRIRSNRFHLHGSPRSVILQQQQPSFSSRRKGTPHRSPIL